MNNKNDTKFNEILARAGLDDKEAAVYLAALKLGGGKASDIAEVAETERSNTYYVLRRLVRQGYCSISEKDNIQVFIPADPDKLYRKMSENVELIKNSLAELGSLKNSLTHKPSIYQYEGAESISNIFDDIVATMLRYPLEERVVLSYLSPDFAFSSFGKDERSFMKRCKRDKIRFRWICPETELARREFASLASDYYYDIRFIDPVVFKAETEVDIYAGKIALIGTLGKAVGTIIDHPKIANSQRELFELAWIGAERAGSNRKDE